MSESSFGTDLLIVTPAEIRRLAKRFQKLDLDESGTLTKSEFMQIPGLEHNPLTERIIEVFDDDKNGEVSFMEFVQAVTILSKKGNIDSKSKFLFKIYDFDADGFISNGELFQLLKIVSGNNLSDVELQQVVDKTIIYNDVDNDQRVNYNEFSKIVRNSEYIKADISF